MFTYFYLDVVPLWVVLYTTEETETVETTTVVVGHIAAASASQPLSVLFVEFCTVYKYRGEAEEKGRWMGRRSK